ncbi:tRNA (guanine-N(7)-)-methyltransferase [Stackebrandtia nassauensis DSM 44728]|uniref:tRNA (guanine-N(7)-)-methyltransferase n=1 Tax=Stackebrandtia nassauensis (strain DSM 44728 / CIP 108903 / NRRL B-16338 / NBRC 102104 / LLR-40K-21) TaxID=446470 RepID=D3Q351_STANL|nr:tRNA (guanosine(46)-N7)-methyltransferase TrmB [Stackebrandtia nassauensis]ADD40021.1 tRNA (guanine-N(7)-)-methyltransferase [Stackebrandtia nassauensis DSM 44728]
MSTIEPSSSIRSFYRRRGKVRPSKLDAYDRLYPVLGVDRQQPPPLPEIFGRTAPVVLEIGSGMGDATVAMAAADPDRDYLAVEVHVPGIANLMMRAEEHELTNLRVFEGDAVSLARSCLPADTLDAIHVFFPDPWPKARHHKRRLISPENVALLRSRLRRGGAFHLATDWEHYAESMLEVLDADPGLSNAHDGFAPRPDWRPVTKFERRGIAEGRQIFDLEFVRPEQPLSLGILAHGPQTLVPSRCRRRAARDLRVLCDHSQLGGDRRHGQARDDRTGARHRRQLLQRHGQGLQLLRGFVDAVGRQ